MARFTPLDSALLMNEIDNLLESILKQGRDYITVFLRVY